MAGTLKSPEAILPTRMTLHVPTDTPLQFSALEFPYKNAIQTFMDRFKNVYQHKHDKKLPYELYLPYRQLNDALLSLAPSLIQGFEGEYGARRMVTFTHLETATQIPEDFPSQEQLKSLIRHWLERWGEQSTIEPLLQGDGKIAWKTLMNIMEGDPETEWRHNIAPASLTADLNHEKGLAYVALPALLNALLHNQTMTIQGEKDSYSITWRRANEGGKNGLHLVSQPIRYHDDYFAYRLDFSVQTQTGYVDVSRKPRAWIFAHLSIQRYIAQLYRKGDDKRNISILVGFNREHFMGGWDTDPTLIRLDVEKKKGRPAKWTYGVGNLLDDFSVRKLLSPEEILTSPHRYANYDGMSDFAVDEYYVVYAEGRKFGDEHERGHQIKTGTTLRERSQIMEGALSLLDGWMATSAPFQLDKQNSKKNTFALRNADYMVKQNKKSPEKNASWQAALKTSLASGNHAHLHIVVLHRNPEFLQWAIPQLESTLMGANQGDDPLVTVSDQFLPPSLYAQLDPGELDPKTFWLPQAQKPAGFIDKWNQQMKESYPKKREQWREFLRAIDWLPNARRLILIDSPDQFDFPPNQRIKAAVRDACNREKVSSQFMIGKFKEDKDPKRAGRLDGNSAGRLKNAVFDLLVRQQGILYAPPCEIYERAAKLDADIAEQLDVIAFCRVQRTDFAKFNYILAVRLHADGEVSVMLPDDSGGWLSYDAAAHKIGVLFSDKHTTVYRDNSPLRLNHGQMLDFVHDVLTKHLERPTIATIEAEGWRNGRGEDEQKHCWTQLRNADLFQNRDVLRFDSNRIFERAAPSLNHLLAVVRLRMGKETPDYITASTWSAEEPMRNLMHLTGYVDPCVPDVMHYMSVAGLPETQKKQNDKKLFELFKADIKISKYDEIPFKHPQIIEMVPFFVHPDFQHDEELRQLCRCIHFLRISPAFTSGNIISPYPLHLGEKLIDDQMIILDADD